MTIETEPLSNAYEKTQTSSMEDTIVKIIEIKYKKGG
jgi:hypothetical protein